MKKKILATSLLFALPLMAEPKVLAFAGSTRKDSYNKQLVREAAQIAQEMGGKVTVIDLKDYPIPLYDGDLEKESGMPKNARLLRNAMIESDVILIASPEYNGSIPAVLKNALDWASRDEKGGSSRAAFKGKRFAIMSASRGGGGGARGLKHLRAVIENIGGQVVEAEVSVSSADTYFANTMRGQNPKLRAQIKQLIPAKTTAK